MQPEQVLYDGRWVLKANFRVFMVNRKKERKLVNSWVQYEALKATGEWFDKVEDIPVLDVPVLAVDEPVEDVSKDCIVKDDEPVINRGKKKGHD